MSTERSDLVFGHWREASDKFDYFVTGAAVALTGFIGGSLETIELGFTASGIQGLAGAAFLLSAFAGFRRLETNVQVLRLTQEQLYSQEFAGSLAKAVSSPGGTIINESTGDVIRPSEAAAQYHAYRAIAMKANKEIERGVDESVAWYRTRNWSLMVGLAMLLASRILPA